MNKHRLTRITTRTGDTGGTGLANGRRLPKTHARIVALGDIDELNAAIGLLCVVPGIPDELVARLRRVQNELFDFGGELSLPGATVLDREALIALETDIAAWNAALPPLTEFVLPGADEANARAHLARAVCRRTERSLWQLMVTPADAIDGDLPRYLNRLSDWLFVLSRHLVQLGGDREVTWQRHPR